MNAGPGGKQPIMRDTIWNGRVQSLVDNTGSPIGDRALLEKRGINTRGLKLEEMRSILSRYPDIANEKCQLEHLINSQGHVCRFPQIPL